MIDRPADTEYAPFYAGYVALVPERDVLAVLASQAEETRRLAAGVPDALEGHRYAPGKWSVREVFGHLGDAERVFGHRAFCFSRGDRAPQPGFDENQYVSEAGFDLRPLAELADEWAGLRQANLRLLRRLEPGAWGRIGTANASPVSVRALAFVMAGHVRHHVAVLTSRYGLAAG